MGQSSNSLLLITRRSNQKIVWTLSQHCLVFGVNVKPELAAEQIEITVDPSASIKPLEQQLRDVLNEVVTVLDRHRACLLPIPLYDRVPFTITPHPRYQLLLDILGEPFREHAVAVASDQVNIGAANEQQAFQIFNAMTYFLPLLMGIAAASPFYRGEVNGVATNRMNAYDAAIMKFSHLTGLPPRLHSLEDYAAELQQLPVFQHPNMFYKYSRPMPQRGVAAEIRCLDKQPTLPDTLALIALCKALVTYELSYGVINQDTLFSSERAVPVSDRGRMLFTEASLESSCVAARQYGVIDQKSSTILLDFLAERALDSVERTYFRPLLDRLHSRGHPQHMVDLKKTYGLEGAYRRIATTFVEELHSFRSSY